MRKQDKIRIGRPPKVLAKLSAPYQQIINEIELTFMYGNPPTWQQDSEERIELSKFIPITEKHAMEHHTEGV